MNTISKALLLISLPGISFAGKRGTEKQIEDLMNPSITSVAIHNPFPKNQTPSWIFRAILKEPSGSAPTIYVERVNFSEPDAIEWQNKITMESLKAHVSGKVIWMDSLAWSDPNFSFSVQTHEGKSFTCSIAPEQSAKSVCRIIPATEIAQ